MTHTPLSSIKLSLHTQAVNRKVRCPYCCEDRTKRDGTTIKGFQRFFCYVCRRYWQDAYIRQTARKLDEQKELLAWAKLNPLIARHLIALPGGVSPHHGVVKYRRDMQEESVSDMLFAYPRAPYHGLWIELKYNLQSSQKPPLMSGCDCDRSQYPSESQTESEWLQAMQSVGYDVKVVYGWQEAAQKIAEYLACN